MNIASVKPTLCFTTGSFSNINRQWQWKKAILIRYLYTLVGGLFFLINPFSFSLFRLKYKHAQPRLCESVDTKGNFPVNISHKPESAQRPTQKASTLWSAWASWFGILLNLQIWFYLLK